MSDIIKSSSASSPPVRPEAASTFVDSIPKWSRAVLIALDPAIPEEMLKDTELARKAHLTARFGLLGAIFGVVYAAFYFAIGHRWGGLIIAICSCSFFVTPIILRVAKRVEIAGTLLTATMAAGFFALCLVEGGMQGHALAWLVSVPLCALLLVGTKAARMWAIISFGVAAVVAGFDLSGRGLPVTFDHKWVPVVSAGGYLGLIVFMYGLGLIFESSRARASGRMQAALKELASSNEDLVGLNLEKNEFLGIAAHDLKSPLCVILGCAEMINMSDDPEDVRKMSESIIAATTRMRNLINDLLDANAIEQGKFASKIEPFDLSKLVGDIIEHNQLTAARKNINLCFGATPNAWVKADVAATTQILENLLSNALKFSPPMTSIRIHTIPETDNMVVTVRDQGPGVSEQDLKKMFGKFTRLTARPTGGESSTGLGLSIVKKLAEAMSGTVQCHSVLGDGATFSLRLPICPRAEIPMVTAPAVAAESKECIPFPTTLRKTAADAMG